MGFILTTIQTILFLIAVISNAFGVTTDITVVKLGVFVVLNHIWFWEELHGDKD